MGIHPFVQLYLPFVEYLGQVFGENCEVLLYDTTRQPVSRIASSNSRAADPDSDIKDAALERFLSPLYQEQDFFINYPITGGDTSRTLRSSAYRIRDNAGATVGIICIHHDITDWLTAQQLFSRVSTLSQQENASKITPPAQEFSSSVEETLHHGIDQLLQEYDVSPDRLTKDEKQEIVCKMHSRGLFTFKSAVSQLAKRLGVSEQTVYRYLRNCQSNY